jgi:hypothetical protein
MVFEPFQLEEYKGHKFFIELVGPIPNGQWFRIHMTNGAIHNLTTGYAESLEQAKQEVVRSFIEFLNI